MSGKQSANSVSVTEENYLKAIYSLYNSNKVDAFIQTNDIAHATETRAASVTDMIKRLHKKGLVHYIPYRGVQLTPVGLQCATMILRRHRLWEVFLMRILHFKWDEVHEMAEQLEHINSVDLIDRLESFLEYPKFDPHGDPIPDKNGNINYISEVLISDMQVGDKGKVIGVKEQSSEFLHFLDSIGLILGARIHVVKKYNFDESMEIVLNDKEPKMISHKVSSNLFVQKGVE